MGGWDRKGGEVNAASHTSYSPPAALCANKKEDSSAKKGDLTEIVKQALLGATSMDASENICRSSAHE